MTIMQGNLRTLLFIVSCIPKKKVISKASMEVITSNATVYILNFFVISIYFIQIFLLG